MLKKLIISLALILGGLLNSLPTPAQTNISEDFALIIASEQSEIQTLEKSKNRKRQFLITRDDSFISKINPLKWTLGGLLFGYQTVFSKHFSADCLYEPTCSNFSKDVIQNYGLAKGVFLTADRLSRCNRIAQTDLHPLTINPNTGHSKDGFAIYKFKEDTCKHH